MDGLEVKQEVGIKETIYQIFDIVFPAEVGHTALGINAYQELAEGFRQLVDVAIEEHNHAMNVYIADTVDMQELRIAELNAHIIEKDAQLQEAVRKEQAAKDAYQIMSANFEILEGRIEDLEDEVSSLNNVNAGCVAKIDELNYDLQSKEETIIKLTEEINKPKANIVIPSQSKPSTNLQQLMEAAKNKAVKSQMDLALSGQTFRGKVELSVPTLGGYEEPSETFQDKDTKTYTPNHWIPTSEVPELAGETPSQQEPNPFPVVGLDQHEPVSESNEEITWRTIEAIQERILRIEQQVGIVA